MNSKRVGDLSEQAFALAALKHGLEVAKPLGDRLPYDFIVDRRGRLFKVQVKTAWEKNGVLISAGMRNSISNQREVKHRWYSNGDFDILAVMDPNSVFFIIPGE